MCKVMGELGEVLRLGESCGECLHVLWCDEVCSIQAATSRRVTIRSR